MINGTRLKEALIFQRSYVESNLWKSASKMIASQKKLNLLRVDEIINWHLACEGKLHDSQNPIRKIGEVIDTKLEHAHTALIEIKAYAERLEIIKIDRKATEERMNIMKRELNESSRSILEKVKNSPEILSLKNALAELDAQLKATTEDYARARQSHPTLMEKFENDKAFQYLRSQYYGTEDYKPRLLVRFLDKWLANRIDFLHAQNIYHSATAIDNRMDDFLSDYALKREEIESLIEKEEQAIQQELDERRVAFSDVVNSVQNLKDEADRIENKSHRAKKIIIDLVCGNNLGFKTANEDLVRLLIREKAAATVRLSKSQSKDIAAQRDKALSIGKERLAASVEAENAHHISFSHAHRVIVIDELLRRLETRQWLTPNCYFDINERSQFFIDIVFHKADIDEAWKQLKAAYLPCEEAHAVQEKELALIA